jgi:hypothetical protein
MYELENVEITKSKVRFTLVSSENLAEPSVEGERAITPVFEIKVQRARRVNAVVRRLALVRSYDSNSLSPGWCSLKQEPMRGPASLR